MQSQIVVIIKIIINALNRKKILTKKDNKLIEKAFHTRSKERAKTIVQLSKEQRNMERIISKLNNSIQQTND